MRPPSASPNHALLLPYALPYLLYVAATGLSDLIGRGPAYALAAVASGAACVFGWRSFRPLIGPRPRIGSVLCGLAAGLAGCVLWVTLVSPFEPAKGTPWEPSAFALRAAASTLIVPLFEEQLMRGYVLGLCVQWERHWRAKTSRPWSQAFDRDSVLSLEPGACTPLAAGLSSVAFAAGHAPPEWLAALTYGALMAALYAYRRDLLTCVLAHAVTNAALAGFVLTTGSFGLW